MNRRNPIHPDLTAPGLASQNGGGMLTIVAVLGLLLVLVQGSVYYKSKGSARFLSVEKNKVLAQQIAEAGVEANIGDLGRRKTRVRAGLADSTTYQNKTLGGGSYTSSLSAVAMGSAADTVDLVSTGLVGSGRHTVRARLKLRKALDTTTATVATVVPETTQTIGTKNVTVLPPTPASQPAVTSTAAYAACMGSASANCRVCHIPGGNIAGRTVMNIPKGTIGPVHGGHSGDYVTTDNTCDVFATKVVAVPDTVLTIANKTVFDTTTLIDTLVKVHILTWK